MSQQDIEGVTINEALSAVIADRCRENQDLAASLLSDSRKAVSNLVNAPVSDNVDISVVQNTPDVVHVALPCYSGLDKDLSLSNEELQQVSGGVELWAIAILAGIAVTVSVVGVAVALGVGIGVKPGGGSSGISGGDGSAPTTKRTTGGAVSLS